MYHNRSKEETLEQNWYYCPHANMALSTANILQPTPGEENADPC